MSNPDPATEKEVHNSDFSYERAVKTILTSSCGFYGEDFFSNLVESLAKGLGVRCCYIGELIDPVNGVVNTLAFWNDNKLQQNLEFTLYNTPCERVPSNGVAHYPRGVQQAFPKDPVLGELNAESYYGIALQDAFQDQIGLLVILDDKPFEVNPAIEILFKMLADRGALEIERLRHEKALILSENKYKNFVELMPDGVIEIDSGGYITFINSHALIMSGYSEEDIRNGLNVLDTVPMDQQALIHANMDLALKGEKRAPSEYTLIRKDGSTCPIRIYSSPVFEDGVSVGIRAIIIDISLEEHLKQLDGKNK